MIAAGLIVQAAVALLLLRLPPARKLLFGLNGVVGALTDATRAGTGFVFGFLGGGPPPFTVTNGGNLVTLAFGVLPLIMVICALSALLWHWRILPVIVRAFAVAALLWLLVLLGRGSVDALTRIDYAVLGLG